MPSVAVVLALAWMLAQASIAAAASPVLRGAEARIIYEAPRSCSVALTITIDGTSQVEHRLELAEGSRATLLDVTDVTATGVPETVGRTLALHVTMVVPATASSAPPSPRTAAAAASYTLRYRVEQAAARRERCPLWLPTVPTDGRSRNVRLHVRLPPGARPGGTMPGFAWTADRGEATLGHLPAFIRVSYAMAGTAPPWDLARLMDVITLVVIAGASLLWVRRKRAPGGRASGSAAGGGP